MDGEVSTHGRHVPSEGETHASQTAMPTTDDSQDVGMVKGFDSLPRRKIL